MQLISPEADHPIQLSADPRQISTALECLLRNAIEAAPAGGWASLRLEMPAPERLDLIVEDSGTGPAPAQRELPTAQGRRGACAGGEAVPGGVPARVRDARPLPLGARGFRALAPARARLEAPRRS